MGIGRVGPCFKEASRADRDPRNVVDDASHGNNRNIAVVVTGRPWRVTLDRVNDSWIKSKVPADGLEAVPPRVVRLDPFVGDDCSNEVNNTFVTAFGKERATIRVGDETQEPKLDQVRVDRDEPVSPGLNAASEWIQVKNMVA